MPSPKTFADNTSLLAVRRHLTYTRRWLLAHPLLVSFATAFDTLLVAWAKVFEAELDLQDQVDAAESQQRAIDTELNRLARRLWKEVGLLTGDAPDAPLRKLYFGTKPLHTFIRPILGGQLTAQKTWSDPLAKSGHKALEEIGQALLPLLTKADAAIAAEGQASKALDEFRLVGARKLFIDEVNTARKDTYTAAFKLQLKHPELTSDIIEGIFLRDRARDEDPTIQGLEDAIAELEATLTDKKERLAKLQKDQKDALAQQKQTEKEEKQKKLAQLHEDMEAKQKEAAALAAELEAELEDP